MSAQWGNGSRQGRFQWSISILSAGRNASFYLIPCPRKQEFLNLPRIKEKATSHMLCAPTSRGRDWEVVLPVRPDSSHLLQLRATHPHPNTLLSFPSSMKWRCLREGPYLRFQKLAQGSSAICEWTKEEWSQQCWEDANWSYIYKWAEPEPGLKLYTKVNPKQAQSLMMTFSTLKVQRKTCHTVLSGG